MGMISDSPYHSTISGSSVRGTTSSCIVARAGSRSIVLLSAARSLPRSLPGTGALRVLCLLISLTLTWETCYESARNYGLPDGSVPASKTLQQQQLHQACKWIASCENSQPDRLRALDPSTSQCADTCVANVWPSYWNRYGAHSASFAHDKFWEICPEIALNIASMQRRYHLSKVEGGAIPLAHEQPPGVHVIAICPTPEFIDVHAKDLKKVADDYSKSLTLNAEPSGSGYQNPLSDWSYLLPGKAARIRDLFNDPQVLKGYISTHCGNVDFQPSFPSFEPLTYYLKGWRVNTHSTVRLCLNATYVQAIAGRVYHAAARLSEARSSSLHTTVAECQTDVVAGVASEKSCISGAFPPGSVSPPKHCAPLTLFARVLVNREPVLQSFHALDRIHGQCKLLTNEEACTGAAFPKDQRALLDGGNYSLLANPRLPLFPGFAALLLSMQLEMPGEPLDTVSRFTDQNVHPFRRVVINESWDYALSIACVLLGGVAYNAASTWLIQRSCPRCFGTELVPRWQPRDEGQTFLDTLLPHGSANWLVASLVQGLVCCSWPQGVGEQFNNCNASELLSIATLTSLSLAGEAVWGYLAYPFPYDFLLDSALQPVPVGNVTNFGAEGSDQCRRIQWTAGRTEVFQKLHIRRCWSLVASWAEGIEAQRRNSAHTTQFSIQTSADGLEAFRFLASSNYDSFTVRVKTHVIRSGDASPLLILPTYSPADLHSFIEEALNGSKCPVWHPPMTMGNHLNGSTANTPFNTYYWTMNCTYTEAAALGPLLKGLAVELLMNHIDLRATHPGSDDANRTRSEGLVSDADDAEQLSSLSPGGTGLMPGARPQVFEFQRLLSEADGDGLVVGQAKVPYMNLYGSAILAAVSIVVYIWTWQKQMSGTGDGPNQPEGEEEGEALQALDSMGAVPQVSMDGSSLTNHAGPAEGSAADAHVHLTASVYPPVHASEVDGHDDPLLAEGQAAAGHCASDIDEHETDQGCACGGLVVQANSQATGTCPVGTQGESSVAVVLSGADGAPDPSQVAACDHMHATGGQMEANAADDVHGANAATQELQLAIV